MMLFLIVLLNFGISWLNCWAVGGMWAESKAIGGWTRLVAWSAAVQAAIGFSSVFGLILGCITHSFGLLPPEFLAKAMSLWYVLVIIPALGTGLILTIQSWIIAYRDRTLLNMGGAAYNTFAQLHNMYSAFEGLGSAFSSVGDLFSDLDSDDPKAGLAIIAIVLVLCALLAGVFLTYVLIKRYAGRLPVPQLQEQRQFM